MLPSVLYLLLQTTQVQTFMVRRITDHFSAKIKSTISIGSIDFKFFNKLSVNDVIIKDQNNDTLFYSKEIIAGINSANFRKKSIRLGKVNFIHPVIALITDSTGMMNLNWYLDLIKGPSDTVKKGNSKFSINEIDIDNARFSLINRTSKRSNKRIDFNHLNLLSINGIIEEFKTANDTTSFSVYNLAFRDSGGFSVKKLDASVTIARQNILVKSATILCDSSFLNIPEFSMKADSSDSFRNFTEKVRLNLQLDKSLLNTTDLKYFLPLSDSLNQTIRLSGNILGTISELRGRNIRIAYSNYTSLDCDFDFSGLPRIENAYLYIGVNNLKTNVKDIEIISHSMDWRLELPDPIKKVGNISFNGSFTGFITDFVTYGEIRTSLGNIRTDLSLRPEKEGRYKIKGLLTGTNINVGELTENNKLFGNLSMQANVDGYANSLKKFSADLTGRIDSIEINSYVYRNITLNGSFTEKTWDGSINIVDKNIKLDLLGLLNFKNKLPEFDFTLNVADANLYKLNFDKLDTTSSVTMLLTSNFKGNNIDNLDGEIRLLNSKFIKYGNSLELYDFSIRTYKENRAPVLSLRTDFVDADIKGYYNFSTLEDLIKSTLVSLIPSEFHFAGTQHNIRKNRFTFNIRLKKTDKINDFFKTGLLLADKSSISGAVFPDSIIHVTGRSDKLTVKNNVFEDFSFDGAVSGSDLSFGIRSASLSLLGKSEIKDFRVDLNTRSDNFIFTVKWDNKDKLLNKGSFIAHGNVGKNTYRNKAYLKVDIDSSQIYSDNNLWQLASSSVLIDSTSIGISKLSLSSQKRSYLIDGLISENPADTLHLEFKGIDISPLNYWINRKKSPENVIPLDFRGHLDGKISLSNVYKKLLLSGDILIDSLSLLGGEFGKVTINSALDNTRKIVNINASNNLDNKKMFDISGYYDPETKRLNLNAQATAMPIGFLNPLLKTFASDISGTATGKLKLSGKTDHLFLTGAAMANNASMKINYLQTGYTMSDSIKFDKKGINFDNIKLTDAEGNTATLSGAVHHDSFHDYAADLIININSSGFQVLNTQPKDNPLFYGTCYASGVAKIKSDQNSISFDIIAKSGKSSKTGKPSKLAIQLNQGLTVSEYSYISFTDTAKGKKTQQTVTAPAASKQIAMDLDMNLEVTTDAEIQIIFDSKEGDVMKGYGSSENLNITLNKKGDFGIIGDYVIEDGDYTFTLGNILNKTFSVENGGKIMFNGNLYDADIDLKANYLNLKTSLAPILGDQYSSSVRVEPQMNLTGKLFNPLVEFDIYLPDADEQTRTYLRNSISTEEELTRQVFSLLLMNSFISLGASTISPLPASATSTTSTGTSAMAATTFEMVSNHISNWLSQLSKDIDIGVNIRPGYNAITPQEAQLALSTQLLNNKITLNGNVDVRGTGAAASNTNALIGDFDAELKLTEKLRLKVFSRYNDIYNGTGVSPYTQGVGIFYKQDFNKFSDLFRKKSKPDMKREDEIKPKKKKSE